MPAAHMDTPRVLGITEATVAKLRDGVVPKVIFSRISCSFNLDPLSCSSLIIYFLFFQNVNPRVINRFWLTLILYELWQHRPLHIVADKYQVNRGVIQNLLNVAATFANSVVRFCQVTCHRLRQRSSTKIRPIRNRLI